MVRQILTASGYLQELEAEQTPESEARQENLKEFLSVAQEFERRSEENTLEDFLGQIALASDIDTYLGRTKRWR
jgi:DNA helicase-2/ATP-dependent DNA helicase PcrA